MGQAVKTRNWRWVRDSHYAFRTLAEVGKLMCLTRQRVEQIEKRALRKLRLRLIEYDRLYRLEMAGEIGEGETYRWLCRCWMKDNERAVSTRDLM